MRQSKKRPLPRPKCLVEDGTSKFQNDLFAKGEPVYPEPPSLRPEAAERLFRHT